MAQKGGSKGDKEPPPAPTTDRPPFSFGASPPPHGVPTYNRPNELTQDKLNLPDPKRRKPNNNAASAKDHTPTSQATKPAKTAMPQVSMPQAAITQAAMSQAAMSQVAMPQAQRPDTSFKCQVAQCEGAKKGFPTKEALTKHNDQVHKEKDPEDPLAFAMEQARKRLGLDAHGKLIVKEKVTEMAKSPASQVMKQSLSAQGPTTNKLEGGTPMSRSLTGHLSTGDGPKTPASDVAGAASKASLSKLQSKTRPATLEEPSDPDSSWQSLEVTQEDLRNLFPLPSDLQGSMNLNSLTPASTISSSTIKSEKNSPKANESTDIDMVKINNESENWLPPAFFHDMDVDPRTFKFPDDDRLSMDWETLFPPKSQPEKEAKTIKGMMGKKRARPTVEDPVFDVSLFAYNPN